MYPWKERTCSFSGCQELKQSQFVAVQSFLNREIDRCVSQGMTCFQSGGNSGFELLAALAVLQRKLISPQIRLEIVLSCKEQARDWNRLEMDLYCGILRLADGIRYTAEHEFNGCRQKRDRYLADSSSRLICLAASGEQERYLLDYAEAKRVPVVLFTASDTATNNV